MQLVVTIPPREVVLFIFSLLCSFLPFASFESYKKRAKLAFQPSQKKAFFLHRFHPRAYPSLIHLHAQAGALLALLVPHENSIKKTPKLSFFNVWTVNIFFIKTPLNYLSYCARGG